MNDGIKITYSVGVLCKISANLLSSIKLYALLSKNKDFQWFSNFYCQLGASIKVCKIRDMSYITISNSSTIYYLSNPENRIEKSSLEKKLWQF